MSLETLKSLIHLVDDNNDGYMNLKEFTRFLYMLQNATPEDSKTLLFYAADKNYDGTIDQSELQNILGKLGVKVRHHTMKKVMRKICDQRDGSISF